MEKRRHPQRDTIKRRKRRQHADSLTRSLTHSLTHSLAHSLSHSLGVKGCPSSLLSSQGLAFAGGVGWRGVSVCRRPLSLTHSRPPSLTRLPPSIPPSRTLTPSLGVLTHSLTRGQGLSLLACVAARSPSLTQRKRRQHAKRQRPIQLPTRPRSELLKAPTRLAPTPNPITHTLLPQPVSDSGCPS